jgi:RNA polymerase sigma-70 factor (ECF subfamily)
MNSAAFEARQDWGLQLLLSDHDPRHTNDTCRWTALLNRIAEGDVDACETFYDETACLTFSLTMHILQNREEAEDALLDAYLEVWVRARLRAHQGHHPTTWLIALVRNTALARLRKNRHSSSRTRMPSYSSAPHRGLRQLSVVQRSIIQLTYFGGLTAREAAHQLGLPVRRVTSEIQTAMRVLRDTCDTSDLHGSPH